MRVWTKNQIRFGIFRKFQISAMFYSYIWKSWKIISHYKEFPVIFWTNSSSHSLLASQKFVKGFISTRQLFSKKWKFSVEYWRYFQRFLNPSSNRRLKLLTFLKLINICNFTCTISILFLKTFAGTHTNASSYNNSCIFHQLFSITKF